MKIEFTGEKIKTARPGFPDNVCGGVFDLRCTGVTVRTWCGGPLQRFVDALLGQSGGLLPHFDRVRHNLKREGTKRRHDDKKMKKNFAKWPKKKRAILVC